MTPKDSDSVNDLFADRVRDWTPASAQGTARMLFTPFLSDPGVSGQCISVLSDAELQRSARFLTEDYKAHFIQRRAFRRYCAALALRSLRPLSQLVFAETEKGRPFLPDRPDLWFSFSSCPFGFLGAWSATHAVGVDIEDKTRTVDPVELAGQFFSKTEAEVIKGLSGQERRRAFFRLWCLKEAALKSIGEGLPFGLDAFEFELAPNLRVVHGPDEYGGRKQFDARLIEEADRCCLLSSDFVLLALPFLNRSPCLNFSGPDQNNWKRMLFLIN